MNSSECTILEHFPNRRRLKLTAVGSLPVVKLGDRSSTKRTSPNEADELRTAGAPKRSRIEVTSFSTEYDLLVAAPEIDHYAAETLSVPESDPAISAPEADHELVVKTEDTSPVPISAPAAWELEVHDHDIVEHMLIKEEDFSPAPEYEPVVSAPEASHNLWVDHELEQLFVKTEDTPTVPEFDPAISAPETGLGIEQLLIKTEVSSPVPASEHSVSSPENLEIKQEDEPDNFRRLGDTECSGPHRVSQLVLFKGTGGNAPVGSRLPDPEHQPCTPNPPQMHLLTYPSNPPRMQLWTYPSNSIRLQLWKCLSNPPQLMVSHQNPSNPPRLQGISNPPQLQGLSELINLQGFSNPPHLQGPSNPPRLQGPSGTPRLQGPSHPSHLQSPSEPIRLQGPSGTPRLQGPLNSPRPRGPSNPPRLQGPSNQTRLQGPSYPSRLQGPSSQPRLQGPSGTPRLLQGPSNSSSLQGPSEPIRLQGHSNPPRLHGPLNPPRRHRPSNPPRLQGSSNQTRLQGPSGTSRLQGPSEPSRLHGPSEPTHPQSPPERPHPQLWLCKDCGKILSTHDELVIHFKQHLIKKYSCIHCKKGFVSLALLLDHKKTVHKKKHQCEACSASFFSEKTYLQHQKFHLPDNVTKYNQDLAETGVAKRWGKSKCTKSAAVGTDCESIAPNPKQERGYTCEFCSAQFSSVHFLRSHLQSPPDPEHFWCATCPDTFSKHFFWEAHAALCSERTRSSGRRAQSSVSKYRCKVCSAEFGSSSNFTAHAANCCKRSSVDMENLRCNLCLAQFGSVSDLDSHSLNPPDDGKHFQHKCEFCPMKFHLQQDLKSHLSRPPFKCHFKCTLCPRGFSTHALWKKHMAAAANGKSCTSIAAKYKCYFCNAECESSSKLDAHLSNRFHRPFICKVCKAAFKTHKSYERHISNGSCAQSLKHKCEFCTARFSTVKELNQHYRRPPEKKHFKCNMCGAAFSIRKRLKRHQTNNSGIGSKCHHLAHAKPVLFQFQCNVCDKDFLTHAEWEQHQEVLHNKKKNLAQINSISNPLSARKHRHPVGGKTAFVCSSCNIGFVCDSDRPQGRCSMCSMTISNGDLMKHAHILRPAVVQIETSTEPEHAFGKFPCAFCRMSFASAGLLVAHLLKPALNHFKCKHCKRYLPSLSKVEEHMEMHLIQGLDQDAVECDHCHTKFLCNSSRFVHIFSEHHTPYVCSECEKRFETGEELVSHTPLHQDANPKFKCYPCGDSFEQIRFLHAHLARHPGIGPFKCDTCSRTFFVKQHLEYHSTVHRHRHLRTRDVSCPKCPLKFLSRLLLENHLTASHSEAEMQLCPRCGQQFLATRIHLCD